MERYNKYLVLKNADIEKYLSDEKQLKLSALVTCTQVGRLNEGKRDQQYVVVAADWPMYETVWGMIEAFVDGKPDELEQLRARVAELEKQLAEKDKLLLLAKEALLTSRATVWDHSAHIQSAASNQYYKTINQIGETLRAIDDSKLVEGLVLCNAEPLTHVVGDHDTEGTTVVKLRAPLFAARMTDK